MQQERKTALVLQGRLNSQRVPNKMIRPFAGTNLFTLALDKLKKVKGIDTDDIYIAVGEKELLDIASNYDFNIFKRSQEGCDSTNDPNKPDSLTLLYEWHQYLQDEGYTHVVLISACNPLLSSKQIDSFYEYFNTEDLDGLFSVTEKHNFYWDKEGETITDWKGMQLMNTRKVDVIYEGAHCLYGSRLDYIAKECWMGDTSPPTPSLYIVSELEATDIDTMEDFEVAEILHKHFNSEAIRRFAGDRPAVLAKKYLDPNKDKSGRSITAGAALAVAHDEIKKAIEIAYYEGRGDLSKIKELIRE